MSFTACKRESKSARCCTLKLHSNLRQHFSTSGNGRIKCNSCSSAFKCCCTSLRIHIQREHPNIEVIDDYYPDFEDPSSTIAQPSDVWKHFSYKDKKAKCDVCMAVLSVSGDRDYSNLWKHLRVMHSAYLSRVKEFLTSNALEVDADDTNAELVVNEASLMESSDCGGNEFNHDSSNASDRCENTVGGSDVGLDEKSMEETEIWWDNDDTSDILAQAITISDIPSSSALKEDNTNDSQNKTDADTLADTLADTTERPKRSLIWTYFRRANPNQVECLKCRGLVKYSSILCTTSNMWKHMELKHQLNAKVLKIRRKPNDKVTGIAKKLVLDDVIEAKERKRKPTRQPSAVWQHFIRHSPIKAECKLCDSEFKISCGSTSNLRYHVQVKHPEALQE